jgi:uncharacterized membrane protein YvbJ
MEFINTLNGEMLILKCVKCHQQLEEDVQFCQYCGRAVDSKWAFTSRLLIETKNKGSNNKKGWILSLFRKGKSEV